MKKKQFKTESQKLLDMMINSIYTHKEIFLRELISNASDAIDKLYFRSLTDSSVSISKQDYKIHISVDKEARTITVSDNGCGMSAEELEKNLGTIAKSGSYDFKHENGQNESVDIIGQFGVGFYSAFMVADKITVKTRQYGSDTANIWESEGVDGYRIGECEKAEFGTEIIMHIKLDGEEEKYSEFLEEYRIRSLIKKYSDYIRYPIKMAVTKSRLKDGSDKEYESYTEIETLNSMVPLWKRPADEVTPEERVTRGAGVRETTVRRENHTFFVEGEWLRNLLGQVNFEDRESIAFFQRILLKEGIIDRLREAGIEEEDIVNIYDFEFEFLN